ncbi:hypothetical protein C8Q76DRAFT_767496 [Earliella scabrosa]|nr:hypothetical protein C8Q76DRAFT_767496 [Earliella scabrosa]
MSCLGPKVQALYNLVDSIPEHAGRWFVKTLSFHDSPKEKHIIRHRDIIAAIRCLWGDLSLSKYLVYKPRKVFSDREKKTRIYSEMWMGLWWNAVQSLLPQGATLAPVILATDKTQLTQRESMCIILEPLREAERNGIEMTRGDGAVQWVYPRALVYPYGSCPKCQCFPDQLHDPHEHPAHIQQ